MSDQKTAESNELDVERLTELASKIGEHVDEFKRAIVDEEDDSDLGELAEGLWAVLDEIEDVLQTVDFEEIPEAIDVDEIAENIDVENVPEGLFDEEKNAIELTNVREAVDLRELWQAVDLTELYQEKKELDDAVDDASGLLGDDEETSEGADDGLLGTGIMADDDDEDDDLFDGLVGMGKGANIKFDAEARQAVIEEKIQDAVVKFRKMLLATHDKLHKLYEMNQEKLGQTGRQPNSLNPTAASTLPSGPVPNSASLRASTVPTQVRHSRVTNPRRIYGHRFSEATGRRNSKTEAEGEEPSGDVDEAADTDESSRADESTEGGEGNGTNDEKITLEVRDE